MNLPLIINGQFVLIRVFFQRKILDLYFFIHKKTLQKTYGEQNRASSSICLYVYSNSLFYAIVSVLVLLCKNLCHYKIYNYSRIQVINATLLRIFMKLVSFAKVA